MEICILNLFLINIALGALTEIDIIHGGWKLHHLWWLRDRNIEVRLEPLSRYLHGETCPGRRLVVRRGRRCRGQLQLLLLVIRTIWRVSVVGGPQPGSYPLGHVRRHPVGHLLHERLQAIYGLNSNSALWTHVYESARMPVRPCNLTLRHTWNFFYRWRVVRLS